MYKQASRLLAGLLLGTVPLWAAAGIGAIPANPGFGEPSYSQAELNQAYGQGRTTGRQEAAGECIGDPSVCGCVDGISPCGISLSSVLSGARFGETEPNDHIVAADGLIAEVLYWGQTPWLQDKVGDWHRDEDWFYVTTQEPNQLLTINFTVPDRVLLDMTRLSQGWLISVRDAAGNVYAQFDTRFALDDPTTTARNESKEIVYPIFLGHVGTYYISVEPRVASGGNLVTNPVGIPLDDLSVTFSPYNLAIVLEYSGMEGVPPDVNFHDVEVEPNNVRGVANALASGVTMFGLLRQTNDIVQDAVPDSDGSPQVYAQTDVDFFKYTSPGNEQISLAWCGREECRAWCGTDNCTDAIFWFIEVTSPTGTPLVSFTTNKAETVHFGLDAPGDYFVEVNFNRTTDAYCSLFSETEFECKSTSRQCQVLTVTEVPAVAEPPADAKTVCTYESGNTCGTGDVSAESAMCELTDIGETGASNHPTWKWETICDEQGPVCLTYSPIIDIGALSVEYNFTWWGTKLVPLTNGTDAYDAYLERPSWYQDR